MTLATRCPACQTIFRVVKDQLLVSDGWVRCGRCSDVFNANEALFDLERDTPPPPRRESASAAGLSPSSQWVLDELARQNIATQDTPNPAERPQEDDIRRPPLEGVEQSGRATFAQEPVSPSGGAGAVDYPEAKPQVHPRQDAGGAADAMPSAALGRTPTASFDACGDASMALGLSQSTDPGMVADDPPPRFVRAADRAAFWRQPAVRATLVLVCLVLAGLLAVQGALTWRDALAAQVPVLRSPLLALCQLLSCRIEPVRRIEQFSVDSSGLTRVEGTSLHRLMVVLKNRADLPLLAPAIELSLTDFQGKLVARKVLSLRDFGHAGALLESGQELQLQATLNSGERRFTGYTVELFYP